MGLIKTDGIREVLGGGGRWLSDDKLSKSKLFRLHFILSILANFDSLTRRKECFFTYLWDILPGKQPADVVLPYVWSRKGPFCRWLLAFCHNGPHDFRERPTRRISKMSAVKLRPPCEVPNFET